MELSQEFSLGHEFRWDEPIGDMAQVSIATYGCDEDRVRLAGQFSVTVENLGAMSELMIPEVRLAVASNPRTPPDALRRLAKDRDRAIRVATIHTINGLPEHLRTMAMPASESPLQKLRGRKNA
ncbi:MAG TPA: hypothetical protein VHZ81_04665 [Galbitalea sp.]|jgi:hypothetical protein|nr:hypothetical protein [Galbitalea sp.]